MEERKQLIKNFPLAGRAFWEKLTEKTDLLEEIRIRADKPLIIRERNGEWYADQEGR